MLTQSPKFQLLITAFSNISYMDQFHLHLIDLWAGIESIFAPSAGEQTFRLGVLISSYLEPPGLERIKLKQNITEMYKARSSVSHGSFTEKRPKKITQARGEHLLELKNTYKLAQRIIKKIICANRVPDQEYLENVLLGSELHNGV